MSGLLNTLGEKVGSFVGNAIGQSTGFVETLNPLSRIFNNEEATKKALENKEIFRTKLEELKTARSADMTKNTAPLKKTWSFSNVPTTEYVKNEKNIINAISSVNLMDSIKEKAEQKTDTKEKENDPTINDLLEQIKCIKCSIKKLELNLKLTNEDGINDGELLTLLQEISGLCGKEGGVKDCDTDLQDFVDEIILKRDMNSIAGLIKLASFMCPFLAFANKSLFSELEVGTGLVVKEEETVGICSKIIGYIAGTGSDTELSIKDTQEEIDFLGTIQDNGVIEGIVSFIGIGGANKEGIENKIAGSIRTVVRGTIKNTINTVFKTATKYQKFICIVFITLLSTHIFLTMTKNSDASFNVNDYYNSTIENAYNTTMRIGNATATTGGGGKRVSKSRRAAKPRAKPKTPANATKPTKPKPKTPTKPTKQPIKPSTKAAAKAAPKKNK